MRKNIIVGHTLAEYNKKYKRRKERLLVFTKREVEEFDNKYGFYVFNNKTNSLEFNNYLLDQRMWWKIEDKFYEIPKPPRYTWFRNLNSATQILVSTFCVCLVGCAIAAPFIVNALTAKFDVNAIIAEEKQNDVSISKKEFDTNTGDVNVYLKVSTDKNIESIAIRSGISELIDGQDYLFDLFENKITFKKSSGNKIKGTAVIYPSLIESKRREDISKSVWLATYKKYSDVFQNSKKMYTTDKISVKLGESNVKLPFFTIPFLLDSEVKRQCFCNVYLPTTPITAEKFCIGGGDYSYELIDDKILQLYELNYDITYCLENNHAELICKTKEAESKVAIKLTFNCNGYIEKYFDSTKYNTEFDFEYTGSPTEEEVNIFTYSNCVYMQKEPDEGFPGAFCSYTAFNLQNKIDTAINFEVGKKYRFCVPVSLITFEDSKKQEQKYIFGIKDFALLSPLNIKTLVTNFNVLCNQTKVNADFSTESINSISFDKTYDNIGDLMSIEFEVIKPFSSCVTFTGGMVTPPSSNFNE